MVETANPDLSIGKQYALLSITRSSFYYQPKGETVLNLTLMRQIDEQFLETPFFGAWQMTWHLRDEGHLVNEKRFRRLMRLIGMMPIYQKPPPARRLKAIGHTRTCCAACRQIARTRSGRLTSPTYRCGAGFCIWSPSWAGTRARCWLGAPRIRWKLTSASRH